MKSSAKPCGLTSRDLYEDKNQSTSKELALYVIKDAYFLEHFNPFVKHSQSDINSKWQAITSNPCR